MERAITELKQDFYTHLNALQGTSSKTGQSTLAILTQEELKELEHAWIALTVWKRKQAH